MCVLMSIAFLAGIPSLGLGQGAPNLQISNPFCFVFFLSPNTILLYALCSMEPSFLLCTVHEFDILSLIYLFHKYNIALMFEWYGGLCL